MGNRLENLYILSANLRSVNRMLTIFPFEYNQVKCNIIFHRLTKTYKTYWTIKLSFLNPNDHSFDFECFANANSLDVDYQTLSNFFKLKNNGNASIKEIFETFYQKFNLAIDVNAIFIPEEHQNEINQYIYNHENVDDRNKIYLFDLRHTGNRSSFNNDKAASRYPEIYKYFADDTEYSFCFTDNDKREVTLDELVETIQSRQSRK